ncbi:hypothetical protein FHEFKHOI_00281 [Candidatus Methanoperedenaceae archaeon GB50]|nr:hypothetical protein AIOGIFDO_00277 [Candidatus Methanoperedenaceae archaeon GB37]CAD7768474.1 hypothetical protein FHEFKHOI_00281 [Candidatus Methanoperedenaceae archaeon GB50]CAD7773777.1 MAG: hypothetical protein KBONHNOK_00652 [Candidatus Methanoperedenaceae archaeon GB50]
MTCIGFNTYTTIHTLKLKEINSVSTLSRKNNEKIRGNSKRSRNKTGKRWRISGPGTNSNIKDGIDVFQQKLCKGLKNDYKRIM